MKTSTNTTQKMAQPQPTETVGKYIERYVKAKFTDDELKEPITGKLYLPKAAPLTPSPKPRPNDNQKLALRLKVAQSKKRLLEHLNKRPLPLQTVFKALDEPKPKAKRCNKSTIDRIKENFKSFQFTPENNKKIQR